MKIKTSELTGAALDWAVAKAQDLDVAVTPPIVLQGVVRRGPYPAIKTAYLPLTWERVPEYCIDWAHGGPIIESERIEISYIKPEWRACSWFGPWAAYGPTPLIAAMRCFFASKLGDEVDVPEELL